MNRRTVWIVFAVLLAMGTVFLAWFDYAAVAAIFHPSTDPAGRTVFLVPGYSNTVYPFTYIAAAASVVGVAIFVYRAERREFRWAPGALLALAVGNLASIGMVDCYEQILVGLWWFTGFGHGWSVYWIGRYWGTIPGAGETLAGLVPVLVILPWCQRRNWPGVALCLGVYALSMSVWFFHGLSGPQNGDALDYWMNAVSRGSSQLVLVAAVSSRDVVRLLAARLHKLGQRHSMPPRPSLRADAVAPTRDQTSQPIIHTGQSSKAVTSATADLPLV
jgi:hypothetical protein